MLKPAALRDHLVASVPALVADPTRLVMNIGKGRVACPYTGSLSFRYHYELELLFTDYPGHADGIVVPLLAWLALHQPDRMINPVTAEESIRFEAEIIDHERMDILITLPLDESVAITPLEDGGYTATHLPEPALPDLTGTNPWTIYLKGEQIAPPPWDE